MIHSEGPRSPEPRELNKVFEFLNRQLRPEADWSIVAEYPTALTPHNIHNMRIISQDGAILSHAVLRPMVIKTPTAVFKVGAIGSVVTDSQHRNSGLSRQVMDNCISEATLQGCDVAILWTSLYDFYRKMDFELAGFEESFQIVEEFTSPIPATEPLKFLNSAAVDPEAVLKLYTQHTVGSVRTTEDIRKFLSIPKTQVHTAWKPDGTLAAYAIEGKGADLTGYIHEWGGQVPALLRLFSHMRAQKKSVLTVISPHHSVNLNTALQRIPSIQYRQGFLGMIRVLNEKSLFAKIHKAARAVGVNDLVLEQEADGIRFGLETDSAVIRDRKDLVRLIFGPFPEIPQLHPTTVEALERVFPVAFWVWGWDSI